MGVRDFDIKAVHLVEFNLQAGNAGALPFARFQLHEKRAAVVVHGAQFVEFGIETGGNDAAIAQERGGFFGDAAGEQFPRRFGRGEVGAQAGKQNWMRVAGSR